MATPAEGLRAPFSRFWLSGFLADFGDGVRLAAFPLLAVQFTRSPVAVAAVTAVQGLPWLVTGAALGVLVDRTDRRRLMVIVDTVQALVIAALAVVILAHSAGLLLVYLTAFVTGLGAALRGTAAPASVPRLVESAYLDQANGRVIAGQIVGNELAGPAAGGWLFGLAAVLPFALNAGALGIAVLLLLTLPSVFGPRPRESGQIPASRLTSLRRDVAEGVKWLWHHADIRDLTVAVGVISAMDALGAIGGGALAATAGIRAPMLVGAVPIAVLTAVLAWRHCRLARPWWCLPSQFTRFPSTTSRSPRLASPVVPSSRP